MFSKLKKFKGLRFIVFLFFIAFSASGQGESGETLDPYEEGEELACEEIPEAFIKYKYDQLYKDFLPPKFSKIVCKNLPEAFIKDEQDNQLHNYSLRSTLNEIQKDLKKFSKEKKVIQADLLRMIADLENIKNIISDNQFSLAMQSDNILFSMEGCLTK